VTTSRESERRTGSTLWAHKKKKATRTRRKTVPEGRFRRATWVSWGKCARMRVKGGTRELLPPRKGGNGTNQKILHRRTSRSGRGIGKGGSRVPQRRVHPIGPVGGGRGGGGRRERAGEVFLGRRTDGFLGVREIAKSRKGRIPAIGEIPAGKGDS